MVAGRTVSVAPRWRSLRRRLRRGGERWDEVCGLGHVEAHDTHVSGHVPACVEACPAGLVVVDRRVARTWTGVHDDDRQVLGRTMSAAVIRCTSMRIAAPSTDCSAKATTATRASSTRFSVTISPSCCPSSTNPTVESSRRQLPACQARNTVWRTVPTRIAAPWDILDASPSLRLDSQSRMVAAVTVACFGVQATPTCASLSWVRGVRARGIGGAATRGRPCRVAVCRSRRRGRSRAGW